MSGISDSSQMWYIDATCGVEEPSSSLCIKVKYHWGSLGSDPENLLTQYIEVEGLFDCIFCVCCGEEMNLVVLVEGRLGSPAVNHSI